jgi:hypothetical protein
LTNCDFMVESSHYVVRNLGFVPVYIWKEKEDYFLAQPSNNFYSKNGIRSEEDNFELIKEAVDNQIHKRNGIQCDENLLLKLEGVKKLIDNLQKILIIEEI